MADYACDNFVSQSRVADINIHDQESDKPHVHIMLTTREITDAGFGKKNRDWNDKELLQAWRQSRAQHANRALECAGSDQRIDHRSLEAQGLDRIPTKHLGHNVIAMDKKGIETDRIAKHKAQR